jgi:hypothetical protein
MTRAQAAGRLLASRHSTRVEVNIVVFFITHVVVVAGVDVGVGFGLFALFGILRFRTGTLPVTEMSFLFAAIALAALNAIAATSVGVVEVVIANVVIVGTLEALGGLVAQPLVSNTERALREDRTAPPEPTGRTHRRPGMPHGFASRGHRGEWDQLLERHGAAHPSGPADARRPVHVSRRVLGARRHMIGLVW